MKTYADERRDEALDAIDSAIAGLSQIGVFSRFTGRRRS